ncbi:hypothetical protein Bca52824_013356 [Brassica carinata]|uniref:GATA-type domain-containing protein n=1 Tax=Brassica carinata TaxID=52824 RepID=A0A8X7W0N2_BRACI|nr:hypothetical protein Bca52824_013356 [Brassica carinata]
MNWLPDEEFKGLSDDFFDELFNSTDFPPQDIDDDNTNHEVGDWYAKFQHLDPPPMDMLTSFPSEFTSSCGVNKLGRVGTVPVLKQGAALTGINSTLHRSSSPPDIKVSKLFQSLSPVSVLESSHASFPSQNSRSRIWTSPVKGMRSKRKRPTTLRFRYLPPFEPSKRDKLPHGESGYKTYCAFEQHAKKRRKISSKVARKCTHCETTETPQWREGPNGPKTLCNACGVRFRSGRLVPEYRPASSPTFIPSVHSNSHRKIIEMRRKEGDQFHTNMIHGVISRA